MANEEVKKVIARIMEKELEETENWLKENKIPQSVRNVLYRGKVETRRRIEKYES